MFKRILAYFLLLVTLLCVVPVVAAPLYILFIGNSYTFVNSLPIMLQQIAASDKGNLNGIASGMAAKGGATLLELWGNPEVQNTLKQRHWDYVVLQEQSVWAMFPERINETLLGVGKWNTAITDAKSAPVFFVTWPRQPGSQWYSAPELRNADYMQQQLMHFTDVVVTPLHMPAVPIGSYWMMAMHQAPSIPLYASDGSHPTPAGTYLAALVFYHFFTHRSLDNVTFHPTGMSDEDAQTLRQIASLPVPRN